MTPTVEPMLLFMSIAALLYVLPWWLWWTALADDGVELRYSE